MAISLNAWRSSVRRLQWHLFNRDVATNRQLVYSHCLRMTGDPHVAEDLVQETMAKGYTIVSQLCQGMDQPKAFLCKVATNLWIDWQRRNRVATLKHSPALDDWRQEVDIDLKFKEGLSLLSNTLTRTEYCVFILREYCGYTGPEIAALLGSTPSGVKMAASRARKKLSQTAALNPSPEGQSTVPSQ